MALPNLKAGTAQTIIQLLKDRNGISVDEIIELIDVSRSTVTSTLKKLRDSDQIHVSRWSEGQHNRALRVYTWGAGTDVAAPSKVVRIPAPKNVSNLPWPRCDVAASWVERRAA